MVKAGKFNDIKWAYNINSSSKYGLNSPNKKVWWGALVKYNAIGATCAFDMGHATWGFASIEYSRVMSGRGMGVGTSMGGVEGTVEINNYRGATLFISATFGIETKSVNVLVFGR